MEFGVQIERDREPIARMLQELDSLDQACKFPTAIEVPAHSVDPWSWLNANPEFGRLAWSDRNSDQILAGVGTAADVRLSTSGDLSECFRKCRDQLKDNDRLRFFGGFSFDGSESWESFGAGRFTLPRLTLKDGSFSLAVMSLDDVSQAKIDLEQIALREESLSPFAPKPVSQAYSPTVNGWQSRVDEALALIQREVIEKIVLSRKTVLEFEDALNPIELVAKLDAATHDCFTFCFNFEGNRSFVGATPEQLFLRDGNLLHSEVVAGTRMRGETPEKDEKLAIELLTSDKDQREHDIVRKSIRQKLHQFIDHLDVDSQASILRLARKQHLRSNVKGELKAGAEDGAVLRRLHPTPAVGGYPTENALPEIARIEPYNRGWYAAPVGWVGSQSAQFAVAIRSGLVESNSLSLFSGAGIVRGSDPDQEWQEVENKIQDFMSILGT